jgi:hypothetical protein
MNGQTAKLKMAIHNVSSGELRNVTWRIRRIIGVGPVVPLTYASWDFDSGARSVPTIGAGRTAVVEVGWTATLETIGVHDFVGFVDVAGDLFLGINRGNNWGIVTIAVERRRITKRVIAELVKGPSPSTFHVEVHRHSERPPLCDLVKTGYNDGNPQFSIRCGPGVGWKVDFQVYRLAPDLINGWVVSDVRLALPSWADSSYRLADWVIKPAGTSLKGMLKTLIDPLDPNRRSPVGGQVLIWVTGPEGLPMFPQ